ncbi:hypothetical protein [Streptomyces flavalbus]|uniref:Ig-like domain-containing protein n=1 Tax=Streptomyces flavalbus TaxID=2665155 RepID=A0ABW2W9V9_9ACTN
MTARDRDQGRDQGQGRDQERDDDYSATVLASHWIQGPASEIQPTPPDRVDGTVLRFGPGVTAAALAHRTLPVVQPPPAPRRPRLRRLRRHTLPALVVLCVLAFLAWQRPGPPLAVDAVTVTARPTALECDGTAHVVGVLATNGRGGTLTYRWVRSDGTASGVLTEVLGRGQDRARLHLRWTFEGAGHHAARAELRVLAPTPRTATARFTYDCP